MLFAIQAKTHDFIIFAFKKIQMNLNLNNERFRITFLLSF